MVVCRCGSPLSGTQRHTLSRISIPLSEQHSRLAVPGATDRAANVRAGREFARPLRSPQAPQYRPHPGIQAIRSWRPAAPGGLWRHALYRSGRDFRHQSPGAQMACRKVADEHPQALLLTGDMPFTGAIRPTGRYFKMRPRGGATNTSWLSPRPAITRSGATG